MSETTKAVTIVAITNLLKVALFVWLAECFGKWWISLFALLFITQYHYMDSKNEVSE